MCCVVLSRIRELPDWLAMLVDPPLWPLGAFVGCAVVMMVVPMVVARKCWCVMLRAASNPSARGERCRRRFVCLGSLLRRAGHTANERTRKSAFIRYLLTRNWVI